MKRAFCSENMWLWNWDAINKVAAMPGATSHPCEKARNSGTWNLREQRVERG